MIQDMTLHNRDVLVANAYQRFTDDNGQPQIRGYDFNSWIDSETALNLANTMADDDVLFEGLDPIYSWSYHRICRDGYVSRVDGIYV